MLHLPKIQTKNNSSQMLTSTSISDAAKTVLGL